MDFQNFREYVEEQVEELKQDPVFGEGPFPNNLMPRKTNKNLYQGPVHSYLHKHIEMKVDYLGYLTETELNSAGLQAAINRAVLLFNEALANKQICKYKATYSDTDQIYLENKNLKLVMEEIFLTLKGSHVRDHISLAIILTTDLLYYKDILESATIWEQIENEIDFNMHILSFRERAKAMYSISVRYPKKCSFALRNRLHQSLLNTDMNGVSLEDLLMFHHATRLEQNNDHSHRKFIMSLAKRSVELTALPVDSTLPVDTLYSFFNNKMDNNRRKKLIHKEEENEEELNVFEQLYPFVSERLNQLSISALMRLVASVQITKVNAYNEFAVSISLIILKRLNTIDPDVLIYFLIHFTKMNYNCGVGDKFFWQTISKYVENNFDKFENLKDDYLFYELFRCLAYHNQLPKEFFKNKFQAKLESDLFNLSLNWDSLYPVMIGVLSMDRTFKSDALVQSFLNLICRAICLQTTPLKYKHDYYIKLFRMLIQARFPDWDLSALNYLTYFADKEFSVWKLKKSSLTPELQNLLNISQTNLELLMVPLMEFENTFFIDLANKDYRFGVMIKSSSKVLSSSKDILDFDSTEGDMVLDRHIQLEILKHHGWHIYELDYQEFESKGNNRAQWLMDVLQREYTISCEKRPDPFKETREDVSDIIKTISTLDYSTEVFDDDKIVNQTYHDYVDYSEKFSDDEENLKFMIEDKERKKQGKKNK